MAKLKRSILALAMASVGFAGLSVAAQAEIYRCQGADGKVVYTSDSSACPGAKPHELQGRYESIGSTPPPARALKNRSRPDYGARIEQAEEARWRTKKRNAEQELKQTTHETEQLRQMVAWCNRGGELYVTQETGIRKGVKCGDAKRQFAASTTRTRELERYLREGLEEECRRAGCLPGWLR